MLVNRSAASEMLAFGFRPSGEKVSTSAETDYRGKRTFDALAATIGLVVLSPFAFLLWCAVRLTSPGPAVFRSSRVGVDGSEFQMLKFRTMSASTPQVATHLLDNADSYLTPIGPWLRRTSLDEIPQLINVARGEMALVGPRPALFNQNDLISLRELAGVHSIRPGVTGLAQTRGRDSLSIPDKVDLDQEYMSNMSFFTDLGILGATAWKVVARDDVSH